MYKLSTEGDPVLRVCVIIIAVILSFAALKVTADIFAPMVLGLVIGVVLAPVTAWLERNGIPRGLAALSVLILGVMSIAVLIVLAEPFVWRIVEELPRIKWEIRSIIEEFRGLIRGLDEVDKEVSEALGGSEESDDEPASPVPNLRSALMFAPLAIAQMLIFVGTLFFFLLTRTGIYTWISHWIGRAAETERMMQRFTMAERLVSRYFLTISVINLGLGAALSGLLSLIGLPGPLIWGTVAALLNFILYLGPMIVTGGLFVAGLVAFEGVMVFAPPAIFLMLNMIEAQFATPALVGKHISVNPLLVFISLIFWLWIWGPIGGFIAIPVLVIFLVMLDLFDFEEEAT